MAEISIDSLKPNSNKYKSEHGTEEKKRLKPVVSQENVVNTKKSFKSKVKSLFIKEDIRDVKRYILKDVLIPGVINTFMDFISITLTGEPSSSRISRGSSYRGRREFGYSGGRTNYRGYYRGRDDYERSDRYEKDYDLDYRNVILKRREDAEMVIDQLRQQIHLQGNASVANLFDLVGVSGEYTDNNYGWTRESQIGLRRVAEGFLIDVDEARYLN